MRVPIVVLLLLAAVLAGCVGPTEEPDPTEPEPDPSSFEQRGQTGALIEQPIDLTDAERIGLLERLVNATGTYHATGHTTFEPTIGATSSGNIFTNSYRGLGSGSLIIRSTDQGQSWDDVTPRLPTGMKMVPNSNDPFIYVDPFTDRIFDFDMCVILQGFCVAYSDDEGESWTHQGLAHGFAPALDHQSLAAAPDTLGLTITDYPNLLVFCVNRGPQPAGAWCSTSPDSGMTWTPAVPGFPPDTQQCSGVHGHIKGSPDGAFYRGNPACSDTVPCAETCTHPAVYRSDDGGFTWTEHIITTTMAPLNHEITVATDDDANVYAFWIGDDGLPYLSWSTDRAETWADPIMVAPPDVTAAGFPALEAGAAGKAAWTYIGTDVTDGYDGEPEQMNWTGYIGFSIDLFDNATVANVPVNAPDDPLDSGRACGNTRCGGFGDFVGITIDAAGRPWAALAHNPSGDSGIVGTLATGPSLRGPGDLSPIEPGKPLEAEAD